nr:Rrf2 family transcriptional regulator [Lysinibacillus parviboronicapiens]
MGEAHLRKALQLITLLEVYRAVEVVEKENLFHCHEQPNPNCPIGAHIQTVLELILVQAQEAMEQVLAKVVTSLLNEVHNKP